mmetsp:Transcript_7813/g.19835  ORF Transcript_7813/g.19835 Transcript_7813/m.19835 type:complete len:540 (+) Transcript_7813:224-1843(+)
MALKDELLAKVESPAARWFLVAVGVIVLLRLRLVLFAAALPLMAYWHYSNQQEEQAGPTGQDDADGDDQASGGPVTSMDRGGADAPWPTDEDDDDDDALFRDDDLPKRNDGLGKETGPDPYDQSFWGDGDMDGGGGTSPWQSKPKQEPRQSAGATDDFGSKPKPAMDSWDAGGDLDDDDLFLGGGSRGGGGSRNQAPGGSLDDFGGLSGGGPKKASSDFDFDFLGGGNDMDLLGSSLGGMGDDDLFGGGFGGGGGGKGKGKGKGKKGEKGEREPREADPKQVFVANVGDLPEDEIRSFFEDVGDVERLKVLRNPDGSSKGVCFVTFATVDQAQKALGLHGSPLEGKNLVVRLAHAGNKGEKGSKGGGKDRDRGEGPMDLGGSERFGSAFGDRDRGDRGFDRDRGDRGGKGGGKGKGKRHNERGEMDELLEDALADSDGPLRVGDFDFAARRFLTELRHRDRADDTQRFQEALDMVLKYTCSKDRSSVRKWPAYIFTLLQKFDSGLWEELRERDAERKREKGGGGFGSRDRDRDFGRRDD